MIPYGKHYLDEVDIEAVVSVLRSGSLTQGVKVAEFEKEKVILMNEYILKNNNTFKTDNLKFSSKLKK